MMGTFAADLPQNVFADPTVAVLGVIAAFLIGAVVGSFLNVCIYRLPLEKSIIWPMASHCGSCWQPIAWFDNIPLISYWLLRGRCRTCGARFSSRYFFVELLTGLGLAGLFYLEAVRNIHQFRPAILGSERAVEAKLVVFVFHGTLFCLLLVATFTDFDHLSIPLPLTVFGTAIGLLGSMVWAWPWPYTIGQALPGFDASSEWAWIGGSIRPRAGVYPWPIWGPLPSWMQPGQQQDAMSTPGTWYGGLATGAAGMFMGMMLLRGIRFCYGLGNPEYTEDPDPSLQHSWFGRRLFSWFGRVGGKALGVGDADLMMMAGSFLGWQPVVVALLASLLPGLIAALIFGILRGNRPFAYGPALACGTVITFLAWPSISLQLQPFFFNWFCIKALAFFGFVGLPLAALTIRLMRLAFGGLRH
jgi:leader peptidase (prepilin peptidase)/N-methyltransferase